MLGLAMRCGAVPVGLIRTTWGVAEFEEPGNWKSLFQDLAEPRLRSTSGAPTQYVGIEVYTHCGVSHVGADVGGLWGAELLQHGLR